ncbi:MAG: cytochrome c [Oceanospirillaceae bacterium]|nr:cytochrome c [Oceanospirillaceae bacterium]
MKSKLLAIISFVVFGFSTQLMAHGGATGVVKERMEQMSDMKNALKILSDMFRGKSDYDVQQVRTQAKIINNHAGDALTQFFPEGSLTAPSEANGKIWQQWADFSALAVQLKSASGSLGEAAGQRAVAAPEVFLTMSMQAAPAKAVAPSADSYFKTLTKTCSACHTKYRNE